MPPGLSIVQSGGRVGGGKQHPQACELVGIVRTLLVDDRRHPLQRVQPLRDPLNGPIGHIPPVEAEDNYYAAIENLDTAA